MNITPLTNELITSVIEIAKKAGTAIMDVYASDFDIQIKDDRSPLTEADIRSNAIINEGIKKVTPDVPVLSEEGREIPFDERSIWESYWLVDPLDGSMNFSRGIDYCCVSIALWQDSNPILGVVYDFNRNEMFSGLVNGGAWLNGNPISTGHVNEKSNAVLATGLPLAMDLSKKSLSRFSREISKYKKIRMI